MSDPGANPDPLVAEVRSGSKYRDLDPVFVARVLADVRPSARSDAATVKAAKRRLHQVFGAFTTTRPAVALARAADALAEDPDDRDGLRAAMSSHVSTAERVPHLEAMAALVSDWCGQPGSVIDLACGLDPLAIPWLDLAHDCQYWCCDIDQGLVDGIRALAPHLPVELVAETVDLVIDVVTAPADLALALKVVTALDQQRPGRSAHVLGALRCADVVVSVPRGSLGGGRRYADPLEQIRRTAAEAGLEVLDDRSVGVEHYVHLRPLDAS